MNSAVNLLFHKEYSQLYNFHFQFDRRFFHHYLQTFQIKKSNENLNFLYHLHLFKRNDSTSVEKRILCQRILSMHDNCRRALQPSQIFSSKKRKNKDEEMCDQFLFHFCHVDNFMEVLTLSLMGGTRFWSNPWRRLLNSCCRCFSHQILSNVASRQLIKSIWQIDEDLQIISLPSLFIKARCSLKLNNNRCFSLIGKEIKQPTTMNNSFTIPFTFNRHITKGHWPIHHRQSTNSLGRTTVFIFTLQQYSHMQNFLQ